MKRVLFWVVAGCQVCWCVFLWVTYKILLRWCDLTGNRGYTWLTQDAIRIIRISPIVCALGILLAWKFLGQRRVETGYSWRFLLRECALLTLLSLEVALVAPLYLWIPYEWLSADRFWD